VSVTLGIPPRTTIQGTGPLAELGVIGSARYGPAAATAHYHFNRWRAFHPYLGGGLSYTLLFGIKDGALSDLAAGSRFGPVLQAGGIFRVTRHWGVFADLKKLFLATPVTGNVTALQGAPVQAQLRLDPFVMQVGLSFRF
jgi:outer membrane protein